MPLTPGTKLGPYEISAALGAGGMGEVYRANDTRLNRTVAIKVLPSHLSDNHELKQRFDREARAISSLTHPHICTLYDVGQQDGIDYLVMEFIEGDTLAQRLEKGALPPDQTLRYATQIAAALDKAHRAGIVHRDLKPGNIMLTKAGAKLLDFGLAKLIGNTTPVLSADSEAPTQKLPITGAGTILGTFQYMAPEQLEGREADQRTDIFALGAVIYEMATGRRAFTGKTQASLITAIMSSEPEPMAKLQPLTPLALERLVKKCLAKDADDRWQSAHDIADELQWIGESSAQTVTNAAAVTQPTIVASSGKRQWLAWSITATLLLTTLGLAWAYFSRKSVADNQPIRLAIPLPEKAGNVLPISISPDGQYVAFHAPDPKGVPMLWLRPLNAIEAKPLAGTEGVGNTHFWSPDSRYIAAVMGNKLKKISISNGAAQVICPVNDVLRGGAWNRDGVILLGTLDRGLLRVTESDKTVKAFTEKDQSRLEGSHRYPQFLPDGQHFLYRVTSARNETSGIYVGVLTGTEKKRLLDGESNAFYAAPGWLLIVRGGELMAQRFDADKLQLLGELVRVGGQTRNIGNRESLAASENGTLIYDTGTAVNRLSLSWLDRSGAQTGSIKETLSLTNFSLSPDDKKLVIIQRNNQAAADSQVLFLLDLQTNTKSRFTFGEMVANQPFWSPDSSKIVWRSYQDGFWQMFQKSSSGTGEAELLFKSEQLVELTDWSPDGQFICYYARDPKANRDLWLLPVTGEHKPVQIFKSDANEFQGRFAPDGKWLAYTSDESGSYEIYIRTFPDTGSKWQVSYNGGTQPRWRRDGKELFYVSTDRKLMALDVQTGATFTAGTPHALFDLPGRWEDFTSGYAVTKDGQRFLFPVNLEAENTAPIAVVQNWTALLKK